ncbi:hypothetical protein EUA93_11305 [Nocardioides oleivorans]|uniref:Uncharacterized protein n=1 Tax=Nocardioides oleivorans TaxID=273676 RepID=A0A4Q2S392_9ACTN|nr:hypothetical protein [Nocardioides oleivorans]RYB94884.1 hypothetical protein EUA93_11305 [Nocardioides oleivorans]
MEDEDYARGLFRILGAQPDPDLEPGRLGDDWIDRSDGFGTEVQVTSVEVVPGPYGAQLEVGFRLEVPPGLDVPEGGSVRFPLDEEWRVLCGFAEPEDYAPRIASRLVRAARDHVVAHIEPPRPGYEPPASDKQRAILLHVLGRVGTVEELGTDRFVVRRGADGHVEHEREVTVILTPEQWEQVLRRHGPVRHGGFDHYEETFASAPEEERFWVFWEGDLVSSTREELPPATTPWPPLREVRQRLAEARASGTTYGWFAYEPLRDEELPG